MILLFSQAVDTRIETAVGIGKLSTENWLKMDGIPDALETAWIGRLPVEGKKGNT